MENESSREGVSLRGFLDRTRDVDSIQYLINRAARKYEGEIPEDCYKEPYMTKSELREQMKRMRFYGFYAGELVGVVGVQNLHGVSLIRHLYVMPELQRTGLGTRLLKFAMRMASNEEILVGTWRGAWWAVDFYEKNGFESVENSEKLLHRYWNIPERQVEESVVLRYEEETEERETDWELTGEWDRGVAFVRGLNMFGSARITKNKMRELCEEIEGEDLKVEKLYGTDNVLFRKRNMHYATVGQRLEKVLEEHFDKKVHVTCRSMRTVEGLTKKG